MIKKVGLYRLRVLVEGQETISGDNLFCWQRPKAVQWVNMCSPAASSSSSKASSSQSWKFTLMASSDSIHLAKAPLGASLSSSFSCSLSAALPHRQQLMALGLGCCGKCMKFQAAGFVLAYPRQLEVSEPVDEKCLSLGLFLFPCQSAFNQIKF